MFGLLLLLRWLLLLRRRLWLPWFHGRRHSTHGSGDVASRQHNGTAAEFVQLAPRGVQLARDGDRTGFGRVARASRALGSRNAKSRKTKGNNEW